MLPFPPEAPVEPASDGRHEVAVVLGHGATHGALHAAEVAVEHFAVHAAEAFPRAAAAAGRLLAPGLAAFSPLLTAYGLAEAIAEDLRRVNRDTLLALALGVEGPLAVSRDPTERLAQAAAVRSALLGTPAAQTAAVRAGLPDERARGVFDRAYANTLALRTSDPTSFAQAREGLERAMRQWDDGVAAGLQGWDDDRRGAAFEAGRLAAEGLLRQEPTLREAAREARRHGFEDARRGRVDSARERRDACYRSGVFEHGRQVERARRHALVDRLIVQHRAPGRAAP